MVDGNPMVSIVTVTRNNSTALRATLESVASQTKQGFELIVIDGHSTDETSAVIRDFDSVIDHFALDAGEGIYAAMNQGAALATGKWLLFMNAGDCFAHSNVLETFAPAAETDLAFGRSSETDGTPKSPFKALDPIWLEMPFNHQAMFCRRSLFEQHPYDASLKIAGDFEFVLWARANEARFERLDLDVAVAEPGGVSDRNYYPRCADWYRVARRHHFWNWRMHFHYYKKLRWARWMDQGLANSNEN
jgi:glycosyltransferase involved in cell wall biosynthesis